jgi:hypothetical protein
VLPGTTPASCDPTLDAVSPHPPATAQPTTAAAAAQSFFHIEANPFSRITAIDLEPV